MIDIRTRIADNSPPPLDRLSDAEVLAEIAWYEQKATDIIQTDPHGEVAKFLHAPWYQRIDPRSRLRQLRGILRDYLATTEESPDPRKNAQAFVRAHTASGRTDTAQKIRAAFEDGALMTDTELFTPGQEEARM